MSCQDCVGAKQSARLPVQGRTRYVGHAHHYQGREADRDAVARRARRLIAAPVMADQDHSLLLAEYVQQAHEIAHQVEQSIAQRYPPADRSGHSRAGQGQRRDNQLAPARGSW